MSKANITVSQRLLVKSVHSSVPGVGPVSIGRRVCLLITIYLTVFPYLQAAGGNDEVASAQYPFWVSSSLCVLSAALAIFCLPHIGQDTIQLEDTRFRAYLEANGYDTRQLGMNKGDVFESTDAEIPTDGLAETAKGEKTAA